MSPIDSDTEIEFPDDETGGPDVDPPTSDPPTSEPPDIVTPPRSDPDDNVVIIDTRTTTTSISLRIPVTIEVVRDVFIPVAPKIYNGIVDFLTPIFDQYYDQRRVGKTLLNYRDDEQYSVLNWKPRADSQGNLDEIALKLRDPLPEVKSVEDRVHVSREIQNSYFDVIKFLPLDVELTPKLRPSTVNISKIAPQTRVTATLDQLIPEIAGGTTQVVSGSALEPGQIITGFGDFDVGPISFTTLNDGDWSLFREPNNDTLSIIEDADAFGGKALRYSGTGSSDFLMEYAPTSGSSVNYDVVIKVRASTISTSDDNSFIGIAFRTRDPEFYGESVEDEYASPLNVGGDNFTVVRISNGSTLASPTNRRTGTPGVQPLSANTWYWIRAQHSSSGDGTGTGSDFYKMMKIWADGDTEPASWDHTITGSTYGGGVAYLDWEGSSGSPLTKTGVGIYLNPNFNAGNGNLDIGYFAASTDLENVIEAGEEGSSVLVTTNYSNFVTNQILEKYYDVNNLTAAPINVDYSDFDNFVTFGSAKSRLDVFVAKLQSIEELVTRAPVFVDQLNISSSGALAGTYETVFGTLEITSAGSASLNPGNSAVYQTVTNSFTSQDYLNTSITLSKQIQELIRTFDDYEKTLWFGMGLPYSGSDAGNYFENTQYLDDFTYPKILGIPYSTTSNLGASWYADLEPIASEYDDRNQNALIKNVPFYLQDDDESVNFQTFVDMMGHHFDNVKIYIQNIENLYSRYPKNSEELSGTLTQYVLESFGVNIPSATSIESLIKYVTGPESGSTAYQDIANEYYKRYMHALPFLLKTKGTKQSVNSLLNVFGINPSLLSVRETLSNRFTTPEAVRINTTEQDFVLEFNSGSYLEVPMSASLRSPQTVQARLALLEDRDQTVLTFGTDYTLDAILHPSASTNTYYANTGRIDLVSASVSLVTSSYFDLFDENFVSLQVANDASGVQVEIGKIENGDLTFTQSLVEPASMSADWNSLPYTYISAPLNSSSFSYTSMSLDEYRLWGDKINRDVFLGWVENPGSYFGNTYTSSIQDLFVRISFNIPNNVESDGYVPNTSPYTNKTNALDLTNISGSGFRTGTSPLYQTTRIVRDVIEITYNAGAQSYTTNMVKISPPPPVSGTLSSEATVVPQRRKFTSSSVGDVTLDVSISPMDAIDRDVIRSFGNINLGDFIGNPSEKNNYRYEALENLETIFIRDLAPTIDYNGFIRYFDKFLKLFYEVVEDYIPARTRLTKGIVIRSSVIDRNRINTRTNIKYSGETARRNTLDGVPEDVVRSYDVQLPVTESWDTDIQATFGNSLDTSVELPDYSGTADDLYVPDGDVFGGYDQDGFTDLYFDLSRPTPQPELQTLYDPTSDNPTVIGGDVVVVTPIDNFTGQIVDWDSHTYFNSPFGLYYVDTKRPVPVTESFMSSQPSVTTWQSGNTYQRGDVVLQPTNLTDDDGNQYSQNGKYFVFIDRGFINETFVTSSNVPQLDTQLWSPLRYVPQIYQDLIRVAFVNNDTGSLSGLRNLNSPYTSVPLEFQRSHFRFYRDNSLGGRRRTYLGTINTIETTADGRPPFETFNLNVNTIQVGAPEQCD